jgi:hypothetical protein
VGITDYQILDPAHDDLAREFCLVLYIGELPAERFKKLHEISQQAWNLPAPNPDASTVVKRVYISSLKKINDYILDSRDKQSFKKIDVPDLLQLKDYLNSKVGEVIELTLPDRRKLGIYPDNQRLLGEYDVEYHGSTVVNIAKLFKLFDASEIIIKEL